MKKILLICLMIMSVAGLSAQRSDRSFVRKGNRLYEDSLFIKAEENYLKAIDLNPELYPCRFPCSREQRAALRSCRRWARLPQRARQRFPRLQRMNRLR